jgi:hypothetical protein
MLLNMKSGAPRRLRGHSVNAAVANIGGGAALKADEMVMMCWFARDVGVAAIRKVEALHKTLFCKKFKETKDGGATDPKPASLSIVQELCRREVALSLPNEFGELAAWPGKAHPCLIQRGQHLCRHGRTLPQMRLSIITMSRGRTPAAGARRRHRRSVRQVPAVRSYAADQRSSCD